MRAFRARVVSHQKMAVWSIMVAALLAVLSACSSAPTSPPVPPTLAPTEALQPQPATPIPPTPTELPTATAEPTFTPSPTATPLPPLAVLADGFDAWCAPLRDAVARIDSPNAPQDARKLKVANGRLVVPIPASACALMFRFNQALPQGTTLTFIDGKNPFLKLPLAVDPSQPDLGWATATHPYVVNPPLWEVTYQLRVSAPDGSELWSKPVVFAKPLPEPCIFGGFPDPVTMWCPITDPWEVEPHPGVVYPYDHNRLLTPQPPK